MVWIQDLDAFKNDMKNKGMGKPDNVDYGYGFLVTPLELTEKLIKRL